MLNFGFVGLLDRLCCTVEYSLGFTALGLVRGVSKDLCADPSRYRTGQRFCWWGFTSCSVKGAVAKEFGIGSGGKGTIFSIKCAIGKDITEYSSYPGEAEVLIQPGTTFEVESCVTGANKLNFITLRHVTDVHFRVM